jgi:hypothetical protein
LELFFDKFEGVVGLLGVGMIGLEVGYVDCPVFGCYVDFWVKPQEGELCEFLGAFDGFEEVGRFVFLVEF